MELINELKRLKSISIRRYYTHLLAVVVGFVFGVLSIQEKEEKVKIKYETKNVPFKEYVFIDVPKPKYVRDTVIKEVKYPVNVFEGVQKTEFGDLGYKASTAGHLLDLEFKPDFQIPVTNKIVEMQGLRFY